MTPPANQRKALAAYLAVLKRQMWLAPWRIDIVWDDGIDADSFAEIRPTFGQWHADLRVCHDFWTLPPWKQRRALAHELIHCYSADVQKLGEGLRSTLGELAYETWIGGFRLAVEHMVDGLTVLIADEDSTFLPLPKLPA